MIDRASFFKRFPHLSDLPIRPQCASCWMISSIGFRKECDSIALILTEYHAADCPLADRDGVETAIDRQRVRAQAVHPE